MNHYVIRIYRFIIYILCNIHHSNQTVVYVIIKALVNDVGWSGAMDKHKWELKSLFQC